MTSALPIPLDPALYQETRYCVNCGGPKVVVFVDEYECGRVGFCCGCEERVFVPFTRATSEAA